MHFSGKLDPIYVYVYQKMPSYCLENINSFYKHRHVYKEIVRLEMCIHSSKILQFLSFIKHLVLRKPRVRK